MPVSPGSRLKKLPRTPNSINTRKDYNMTEHASTASATVDFVGEFSRTASSL